MKNIIGIILFYFIATSSSFAQWGNTIVLSDNITTETKSISDFNKISANDDFIVYIKFSNTEESVQIEANENLHDLIKISIEDGELKLGTKSYSTGRRGARERLVAHVTAKRLVSITASDDAEIKVLDDLIAKNLILNLDDDAVLKIDARVENLIVNMASDAELHITGNAQKMTVDADSDSYIHGLDFIVQDLDIKLDGDSEAQLTVNGNINVTARGDSEFTYKGDGKIERKRLSGDSEINAIR